MKFRKTNRNFPKHTEISFSYLKYTGAVLRLIQMGRTFFCISFHFSLKTLNDTRKLLKSVSKRLPITVHAISLFCVAFLKSFIKVMKFRKTNHNFPKHTGISFSYLKYTGAVLRLIQMGRTFSGISFHFSLKTLNDTRKLLKSVSKRLPITVYAISLFCVAFFENHSGNL